MDRIEIGALTFVRSAAAADNRLEAANMFKERSLDLGGLACDTLEADLFTSTLHAELSSIPGGTPVLVYRGERQAARFFTKTIRRTGASSYHASALSAMSVLTTMPHPGGIYTGQTAEEVVRDICGGVPVAVKSNFAKIALYGWLPYVKPPETSARDNLSQVLFAIGASLGTDLDGVLRVEPLWDGVASVIAPERLYDRGSVEYDSRKITAVTVTEHQYVQGGESKELFSGTTQEGDVITFDAPMHSLTASGFTIRKSGANYAVVSSGSGTLTGRAYVHTTRQVTEPVLQVAEENVKTIKDATLVSLVNSTAVAKRLAAYCRCTETIKNPVVAGKERPGDVVSIYHPYDKKMVRACIASADTTLSSTLKSDLTALVGFEPPRAEDIEYYNMREVLTGSGEWIPPEGVDSVRVVLIGGGSGGERGENGESAAQPTFVNKIVSSFRYHGYIESAGARGGSGGNGGLCGNILEVQITINGQKNFQYMCGTGGVGASVSGLSGASGTDTTFGIYSSSAGATQGDGYFDIITKEVYAKNGEPGVSGGEGSGGSGSATAENQFHSPLSGHNITYSDVIYEAGLRGSDKDGIDYDTYGDRPYKVYGGYGGGAAAGRSGLAGKNASASFVQSSDSRNRVIRVVAPSGGNGADAVQPQKSFYGCGGSGGNGGGGAGGNGSAFYKIDTEYWATSPSFDLPSTGGKGSNGGSGGEGCIILYYRKAKTVKSGPIMTADGRFLLDPHGRRMIV